MKKGNFLILVMMVWWLGLVIRSFFGWNSNKTQITQSEIPQYSDTWFVDTLTDTWDTQQHTSSTTYTEETNIPEKNYTEIRLMMPKYFYNPERKIFAKDLYSGERVHINFIFIDNLNEYRNNLLNDNFSDADIILFPYDWNEFVKVQNFSFQKSLKPAFDDFVWDIIQDTNTSFLPFAVDPMIMYILPWYTLTNFSDIWNFAYDRPSPKPLSFPIFFWITDEDYYDKWFAREYQDIMRYALLHYFTTYRNKTNEEILSNWIDSNNWIWTNINWSQNYNVSNLKTILDKIDISECKNFPSICFQLYDLVWLRFGFLSDLDVIETYFQTKKSKFTDLQKQRYPFFETENPVRIRWRAIPDSLTDIDTINAVYRFLVKYMNSNNEYDLRNSTISTFKSEWNIIDNPSIWSRWYILSSGWDFLEKLKSTRAFRQLLDYEITAQEYLKRA